MFYFVCNFYLLLVNLYIPFITIKPCKDWILLRFLKSPIGPIEIIEIINIVDSKNPVSHKYVNRYSPVMISAFLFV